MRQRGQPFDVFSGEGNGVKRERNRELPHLARLIRLRFTIFAFLRDILLRVLFHARGCSENYLLCNPARDPKCTWLRVLAPHQAEQLLRKIAIGTLLQEAHWHLHYMFCAWFLTGEALFFGRSSLEAHVVSDLGLDKQLIL